MTGPAIFVPLHLLARWNGNARRTPGASESLCELAASIDSVGVINPLTVFKRASAFLVVAGSRRHAALLELQRQGIVPGDYPVPCTLTTRALAPEVSLAENAVREDMHPADECEAFLKLSKAGLSNEEIGAKFGCTPSVVARRLKLARVCPEVLAAYREGTRSLDAVMAYAVTDNVRRQKRVFAALEGYRAGDPGTIRAALTEDEVDASDRRVQFVTLAAYLEAGGTIRRDLFAAEDDLSGTYLLDAPLLESLALDKLLALAETVRAEGWAWVEARLVFDYADRSDFRTSRPVLTALPDDLAAEAAALDAEREALYAQDSPLSDEQGTRFAEIDARVDAIEAERREVWPDDVLAVAGCVVSIGYDGEPEIHRGLHAKRLGAELRPPAGHPSETESCEPGALSQRLTQQLTSHRTVALAAALSERPAQALAAVVYSLASSLLVEAPPGASCLRLSLKPCLAVDRAEGPAAQLLTAQRKAWLERIPTDASALWGWCLAQETTTLLELLAFLAAMSVDAVVSRGAAPAHADQLARALSLDMATWFRPTAENYFLHVSKEQIIRDIEDIGRGPLRDAAKLKKAVVASFAERRAAENETWVPALLRTPEAP